MEPMSGADSAFPGTQEAKAGDEGRAGPLPDLWLGQHPAVSDRRH